jgi:outer membrane biosynthesis protein TonB
VGLPQIDFRVPEATWFKSAFAGRFGALGAKVGSKFGPRFGAVPGLHSTGALAWPYKIAVVAVMALVACGTLVTFGSAGAETKQGSSETTALPGSDEANPIVEGQVLPPTNDALLNSTDLLSTLNLTDFSPDGSPFLPLPDDEDDDENKDDDAKSDIKKKLAVVTPTPSPTKGTDKPKEGTDNPSSTPTNPTPSDSPKPSPEPEPEPVEGPKHKQWAKMTDKYASCLDNAEKANTVAVRETQKALCKTYKPGSEPDFTA